MANHLINECSPYLLQHAHNPVDWYPWCEEAFREAREQDKPILLSIGYAACHWCHVMAHESFENLDTAAVMNNSFVNIKVDREERPDLDNMYMQAVVGMTGSGGWPMTVFLTHEKEPFYGGTYFPPTPRYGMPSFVQVLEGVAKAWRTKRGDVEAQGKHIAKSIGRRVVLNGNGSSLVPHLLDQAMDNLWESFDRTYGGFGSAPKFPPSMALEFLLCRHDDARAEEMLETTLRHMALGGLFDQLGGGLARYSTDAQWLIPHFEKMLYDNALLARVYLHAFRRTGLALYRETAEKTLDFMMRKMRHEDGGFYSSYDADSEGVEGKYYVWSLAEVENALGQEASLLAAHYDITSGGNWEGHNILHVAKAQEELAELYGMSQQDIAMRLDACKAKLLQVRNRRTMPGLDSKVITSWNGLALAAFAEGGTILNRPDYLRIAMSNAQFLRRTMRTTNGRLLRTWKSGASAKHNGCLEDYAYLADGLLALYQNSLDDILVCVGEGTHDHCDGPFCR